MSLVANFLFLILSFSFASIAHARTIHLLVIAEEGGASCSDVRDTGAKSVFQMGKSGALMQAVDDLDRLGCVAGRVWVRLGDELVKSGTASKVVFVPVASSQLFGDGQASNGASLRQRTSVVDVAMVKNIHFDYALWQLSEPKPGRNAWAYASDLRKLIKFGSVNLKIDKWVVAQTGSKQKDIADAQLQIAPNFGLSRFVGPAINTGFISYPDALSEQQYADLAHSWFIAMRKADQDSIRYQKESLQYYFK